MKTKITLFCLLIALSLGSKAQYVTIPDANFVAYLQAHYPSCMNGNQMDTTCAGIQYAYDVTISQSSITDLTGIKYFISLQHLDCTNNQITSLPTLPNSLQELWCGNNQLTNLPTLPYLLKILGCYSNNITSWPILPNSLIHLICSYCNLTSLPVLPASIIQLDCSANSLTSLPPLPNSLVELICDGNPLTSLPSLPSALFRLSCSSSPLTSLPPLPASLGYLNCYGDSLTTLPSLPNSMTDLNCGGNFLSNLPTLPNLLTGLYCNYNQLTNLPVLPPSLKYLNCGDNNISCFSIFPNSLTYPNISGNPFTCLPNYVSGMDATTLAFPLCMDGDLVNNPDGCVHSEGIVGSVYKDNNSDCNLNANEQGVNNVHLKLYDNSNNLLSQLHSCANGIYNFPETAGTYTVELDTLGLPFRVQCMFPGVDTTIALASLNPVASNVNFAVSCKPGFDIGVKSVFRQGGVFPGIQHRLSVVAGDISNWYNLHCAAGIAGQVQISVTGPVTFDSVPYTALTPSIAGSAYTYSIADFSNVDIQHDFALLFTTDTIAQAGDQVCVNVLVTPSVSDNNTSNNNYQYCYTVTNSYDPNLKEVYPVNVPPGYQDYFTYSIHFQNTGTAPAMNIRLADTLDSNLDLETFQVINYSHYNTVSLKNNILTFHFPNIQLPDSTSNLAGSQGFVQYRIKPKANLPAGTQITNTANIYFDYNAAVVTNTTTNQFLQALAINENKTNAYLSVYPNPGNGRYFVKLSENIDLPKLNLEVYNLLGELVLYTKLQNYLTQIDLSNQPKGVYLIRVKGASQQFNKRIVKQ